jgi:hypothetical protein
MPDPTTVQPAIRRVPSRRPPLPVPKTGGGIIRTVIAIGLTQQPLRPVPLVKGKPMSAQTSLAASTRQGTVEGASFAVPTGAATVQVDSTMNAADILSPAGLMLDVYLEVSYDGQNFDSVASVGWVSGPGSVALDGTTPEPPGVAVSAPAPNAIYRARLNAPQSVYVGATISFYDPSGNLL